MAFHYKDIIRLSATELQHLLRKKELTSVELVKECLAQIERHNKQGLQLQAVISTAPSSLLLDAAAELDAERAKGTLRGPFHGIPILIKDAYLTNTALGMPTTVGSFALKSATSNRSANVVDTLIRKGLIVIGKTNLNEWSSWKSMGPMNGWSAVGGQTISAYVEGGLQKNDGVMGHTNPCGASTGSAVAVSAGFAPVALGTEVDGSLVQPAARAALYALKPTIGATDLEGTFAVSEDFDSLGAMAKSAADVAILTEMLLNDKARAEIPSDGYLSFTQTDFEGLKIGFVDPEEWHWPEALQPQHDGSGQQMRAGYLDAIDRVKNNQGAVVYPVTLPPVSELMLDGQPATIMAARHVFKQNVDRFLGLYETSDVRSVEDIIQYNKDHAEKELPEDFPEQGRLIHTLENPIDNEGYQRAISQCHKVARDRGVDTTMAEHDLNLIAFPMDSPCPRVAAAAGYPIATVPLGKIDYKDRPFGLAIIAKAGREDLLLRFMSAYEASSDPRALPARLVE